MNETENYYPMLGFIHNQILGLNLITDDKDVHSEALKEMFLHNVGEEYYSIMEADTPHERARRIIRYAEDRGSTPVLEVYHTAGMQAPKKACSIIDLVGAEGSLDDHYPDITDEDQRLASLRRLITLSEKGDFILAAQLYRSAEVDPHPLAKDETYMLKRAWARVYNVIWMRFHKRRW